MKKCMGLTLILLMFVCLVTPAQAQKKKLAQTGFQFLKIGLSARAEAMGGAYSMVGDGADAMFYNPAGMARMDSKIQMVAHRVQWIADINYTALGTAYKASHGVFAVNFGAVNYGELIGTQVARNEKGFTETGSIDVGAYFAGLAYSKQLTNKFFIGGQIKYVSEHLGSSTISPVGTSNVTIDNKADAINFTFGTIYYTGLRSLRLGIYIRNFSPEIEYQKIGFQLPLTFHIGAAMELLDSPSHSLSLAFDAIHPRDFSERIYLGGEYWFQEMLALRVGYKFNHDMESLTAGAGIKQRIGDTQVLVDYSFTKNEFFDSVSRFSVGIAF